MTLRIGGGALKLRTATFENEVPANLFVNDYFSFTVIYPITPPEDPGPNEVKSLQFRQVPAYGIQLTQGLKILPITMFYPAKSLLYRKPLATLKIRKNDDWVSVNIKSWDGNVWKPVTYSIWDGSKWSQ